MRVGLSHKITLLNEIVSQVKNNWDNYGPNNQTAIAHKTKYHLLFPLKQPFTPKLTAISLPVSLDRIMYTTTNEG